MISNIEQALELRIATLLDSLSIARAHFVAQVPGDWTGVVSAMPNRVATLTLVCPPGVDWPILGSIGNRSNVILGDQGRATSIAAKISEEFPETGLTILENYAGLTWDDTANERSTELAPAMLNFLKGLEFGDSLESANLSDSSGEISGITYQVSGAGPAVVLLPLGIAPSQWTPILPTLQKQFTTIVLGGAHIGLVSRLEERSRSGYLPMVNTVLDALTIANGETILDLWCGSGPYSRFLARRTRGANHIVAVDVNPYLLSEGKSIAATEGLRSKIDFRIADALGLPFDDGEFDVVFSCTILEEGDADRMIEEILRVTRTGGRIGVIVRATDRPGVFNIDVDQEIRRKAEATLGGFLSPGSYFGSVLG